MNITSLEACIKTRATNRMNKEIDVFKRVVQKALMDLTKSDNVYTVLDPVKMDETSYRQEVKEQVEHNMRLLKSCLCSTFVYPRELLTRYIDIETKEIIKLHESFLALSANLQKRDDIESN